MLRVVAPECGEGPILQIQHGQVETELKFVIDGVSIICPILCLVVGQGLTLQDTGLPILLAGVAPVDISQCIRKVRMLIEVVVIGDGVSRPLGIEMRGNRLQHVPHLQLVGVGRRLARHTPLLHHPQFQRGCPRRQAEYHCHITATNRVLNIALRPVLPAFQPPLSRHARTVA